MDKRWVVVALGLLLGAALGRAWAADPTAPKPPRGMTSLVLQADLGTPAGQSIVTAGAAAALTDDEKKSLNTDDPRHLTYIAHEQAVSLRLVGLRPTARYVLRVQYLSVGQDRGVRLITAAGDELHGAVDLPRDKAVVREVELPRQSYASAVLQVSGVKVAGPSAVMSAVELWSDTPGLLGPIGSFVRFRIDAMPTGKPGVAVSAAMKIHQSPWNTPSFPLTGKQPVTQPGLTPWVDLRKQPGAANGSLVLALPPGAKGATQFAVVESDDAVLREINWDEPDAHRIILDPSLADIRTFRDQERRYYLNALTQNGDRLRPLTRPPLMFSNAWGHTTGAAAEYMVKTFRVLGFNSVETSADAGPYESLYGWSSQGGHYAPPTFVPHDEAMSRQLYGEHYRKFFDKGGKGAQSGPGMRVFQLADEPGELAVKETPEARAGFVGWLKAKGLEPKQLGKESWEAVTLFPAKPTTPAERRLHYWTRRYQAFLTPRMFALAADAVREQSPGKQVRSYVALSGHALYFPSKMPLDMFQLAQYPNLMPGVSDWMTGGSWWWDSHQSVAFSVAPYNAGARRYGKESGQPPISFPMMHCVNPSPFRAYTQLANNCKLISYYNYGPDYEATEGFWSHVPWEAGVVGQLNNRVALVDDILGPGVMRRSRVAMLYSEAQEVWWPQGSFADKRASFLTLSHDYYQPELVTEQQVLDGALGDYDALYVLDQFVSRSAQDRIEGWVKSGGMLWACADAAVCDEYQDPADLLERMAGLKRDHSQAQMAEVQVAPVEGDAALPAHAVPPLGRNKEVIRPGIARWEGARVRARYADGQLAWAEKAVGKGRLVYVGHRAGLSLSRRTGKRGPFAWWQELGRQFLVVPLTEAKVERELSMSAPFVMASALSTDAGTVIVLYDMNAQPPRDVVVLLKEPARPHSVQTFDDGGDLVDMPFDFAEGCVRIVIPQVRWNGQMIVVRRRPAPADDRIAAMKATTERGLASEDWQALSAAAWFAGFYPDWQLAARLVPLLKHEHWAVRRSAAESLGRLRHAPAGNALTEAAKAEKDNHALADQIVALARLRHGQAGKAADRLRSHADPTVRSAAATAREVLAAKP